jgi:hypothetical protein
MALLFGNLFTNLMNLSAKPEKMFDYGAIP